MALRAIILGAVLGGLGDGLEGGGIVIGALAGVLFWEIARRTARAETDARIALLRAELDRERAAAAREREMRDVLAALAERPRAPAKPAATSVHRATTLPPSPAARAEDTEHAIEPAETVGPGSREPDMVTRLFAAARDWLVGGNTVVRVGIVILVVGLSFLIRYAAAAGLLPIELRLGAVAAVGVALLVIGWRTRIPRPDYGLALQGAGVAVLYLTLFAAAKLLELIPALAAFGLMVGVCGLGAMLAVRQRSQALAVTAFAGGYAVPLLLSDASGAIGLLFAYYTLLNLALLAIARRQHWRVLNLLGVIATFGVAGAWWWSDYTRSDYWRAQAFLAANVLIYLGIVLRVGGGKPGVAQPLDAALLFVPPLAGFALQVRLLEDDPYGSAVAALIFGMVYLTSAALVLRRRDTPAALLGEPLLAIGVGFVTLAVPLAFDAGWTSALWALEGAGAVWIGARQGRWLSRAFGLALQLVATLLLFDDARPLELVGALLVALTLAFSAWWLRKQHGSASPLGHGYAALERSLAPLIFLAGFGVWQLAWTQQAFEGEYPFPWPLPPLLSAFAYVFSAWGAYEIGRRTRWAVAAVPARLTVFALGAAALVLATADLFARSSSGYGLAGGMLALALLATHLFLLHEQNRDGLNSRLATLGHIGTVWLVILAVAHQLMVFVDRLALAEGWAAPVLVAWLAAALAALTWWAVPALVVPRRWPLTRHARAYAWRAAAPLAVLLGLAATLLALWGSGEAPPLPRLPVLNPVDLIVTAAIAVLFWWRDRVMATRAHGLYAHALLGLQGQVALGALGFLALSTIWLRAVSAVTGLPYDPDTLLDDVLVQAGLALIWTLLALAIMVAAHRRQRRRLWLAGAGLLGLTVAKLLLVDLNAAEGAARIVAFTGVGGLMLLVGYLAPIPPLRAPSEDSEPASAN